MRKNILTMQQILTMLVLQDEMNAAVNPDWRKAGNKWTRAILVEAVEAIDHHGWKWWKASTRNLPQLQIELVDIWHFMLSKWLEMAESREDIRDLAEAITNFSGAQYIVWFDEEPHTLAKMDLLETLELLAGLASVREISLEVFDACLSKADMTWEALYKAYIGKNCLNIFRQQNGYKDGSYIKNWTAAHSRKAGEHGIVLEDNDVLDEIMPTLDITSETFKEEVMLALQEKYAMVKQAQQRG